MGPLLPVKIRPSIYYDIKIKDILDKKMTEQTNNSDNNKPNNAALNRRTKPSGRRVGEKMIHRLVNLGIALSSERDINRLLEMILLEAKEIYNADGGTFYLVSDDESSLSFEIIVNDSLNIAMGGTTGKDITFPAIALSKDGKNNLNNVASAVFHKRGISNIDDAYQDKTYDFSGTKAFDENTGYRSKSFLTVPLINNDDDVIGILQLINARDKDNKTISFSQSLQPIIEALTSQAAVSLDNQQLIKAQQQLWNSLIEMLASAIDEKSPYTGGHCQRVPEIVEMLAKAACETNDGIFSEFNLNANEWYELHVAAWLHDCGKIITPEYIVDKATKLESVYNRIHEVRARFEILRRDAEIKYLKKSMAGDDKVKAEDEFKKTINRLETEFAFIANANIGGEFMDDEDIEYLKIIGKQQWTRYFNRNLGLSPAEQQHIVNSPYPETPTREYLLVDLAQHKVDRYNAGEIHNLSIKRGTLTAEERLTINAHINDTINMLNTLPFPKKMRRVPEYAGGHHEKMDGTGYPNGLKRDEMSIPARIMAIADIYEALTADDRPYKKAKTISESLRIMSNMAKNQHIDVDIFNLFLTSSIWKNYANKFLASHQIDEVDIEDYIVKP